MHTIFSNSRNSHLAIKLHPVRHDDQMIASISIECETVWIGTAVATHHNAAVMSVDFVVAGVAVIPLRARLCGGERVTKGRGEVDWALRNERHSVVERSCAMKKAVPVNCRAGSTHQVDHINDNRVAFAHVNRRSRDLSVDAHDASFDAIGRNALVFEAIASRSYPTKRLSAASTSAAKKRFSISIVSVPTHTIN